MSQYSILLKKQPSDGLPSTSTAFITSFAETHSSFIFHLQYMHASGFLESSWHGWICSAPCCCRSLSSIKISDIMSTFLEVRLELLYGALCPAVFNICKPLQCPVLPTPDTSSDLPNGNTSLLIFVQLLYVQTVTGLTLKRRQYTGRNWILFAARISVHLNDSDYATICENT